MKKKSLIISSALILAVVGYFSASLCGRVNNIAYPAEAGDIEQVRNLLDKGFSVHAEIGGNTALYLATVEGHEDIVRLLLAAGAEIEAQNRRGLRPLHMAALNGYDTLVELFIDRGAEVNIKDNEDEDTPLHLAAKRGRTNATKLLLAAGADITTKNRLGLTPLDRAQQGYNTPPELIKLLQPSTPAPAKIKKPSTPAKTKVPSVPASDPSLSGKSQSRTQKTKARFGKLKGKLKRTQ